MLLWRLTSMTHGEERSGKRGIECHLMRRDMEYQLTIRVNKTIVATERYRTPVAAAERAEAVRRQAKDGELHFPQTQQTQSPDDRTHTGQSKDAFETGR